MEVNTIDDYQIKSIFYKEAAHTGVGILLGTHELHVWPAFEFEFEFPDPLSILPSCKCAPKEAAVDEPGSCVPDTIVGNLDEILGPWLCWDPALPL